MAHVPGEQPDYFLQVVPPRDEVPTAAAVSDGVSGRLVQVVALVFIALVAAWFAYWWLDRGPQAPTSQPPPRGGELTVPETLSGVPRSPESLFAPLRESVLEHPGNTHPDSDMVFQQYVGGDVVDRSILHYIAVTGPEDHLPDLIMVKGYVSVMGDVACSRPYIGEGLPQVDEPVQMDDGSICWRSSGDFSISVLSLHGDFGATAAAVNEAWQQS